MVTRAGFEPATFGLWARRAASLRHLAMCSRLSEASSLVTIPRISGPPVNRPSDLLGRSYHAVVRSPAFTFSVLNYKPRLFTCCNRFSSRLRYTAALSRSHHLCGVIQEGFSETLPVIHGRYGLSESAKTTPKRFQYKCQIMRVRGAPS